MNNLGAAQVAKTTYGARDSQTNGFTKMKGFKGDEAGLEVKFRVEASRCFRKCSINRFVSQTSNRLPQSRIWVDVANFNKQLHGDLVSLMEECTEGGKLATQTWLQAWRDSSKSCECFARDLAMMCRTSGNRYTWCASTQVTAKFGANVGLQMPETAAAWSKLAANSGLGTTRTRPAWARSECTAKRVCPSHRSPCPLRSRWLPGCWGRPPCISFAWNWSHTPVLEVPRDVREATAGQWPLLAAIAGAGAMYSPTGAGAAYDTAGAGAMFSTTDAGAAYPTGASEMYITICAGAASSAGAGALYSSKGVSNVRRCWCDVLHHWRRKRAGEEYDTAGASSYKGMTPQRLCCAQKICPKILRDYLAMQAASIVSPGKQRLTIEKFVQARWHGLGASPMDVDALAKTKRRQERRQRKRQREQVKEV